MTLISFLRLIRVAKLPFPRLTFLAVYLFFVFDCFAVRAPFQQLMGANMEGVTAVNVTATKTKFQKANLKNAGMFPILI